MSINCKLASLIVLLLTLPSLGFGPPKLTESDSEAMPVYWQQLESIDRGRPPQPLGTAELIMDAATGRVVFERNARQRVAPASLTKIMTAIVTLEKGNLKDKVVIKPQHLEEGAAMGLIPGDIVTVEDLLWGLLLPSGNDAATAIADHLGGGSVEKFVKMMNDKASELGLTNTHFLNPHGLDEEGHYSTAYDLAEMSKYALSNPLFAKMVATNRQMVQASRVFYLENANQLLRRRDTVPGVDGIKTGLTEKAGDCLIASVTRGGHRIIAVVLGTESRAPAATRLINYAFDYFTWVPLKPPLGLQLNDASGNMRQLALATNREEMLPPWQRFYIRPAVRIDEHNNPSPSVGAITYSLGGTTLAELLLRAKSP